MNKTHYYFAHECLKQAFEECKAAIFSELTSAKAIELEKNVIVEGIFDPSLSEEIFERDNDIYIELPSQLKEQIEFLCEELEVDIANIYITKKEITDRISEILIELDQQEDREDLIRDFSLSFIKNSNASTLFNVLFAREITLLNFNNNEEETEYILEYSDFDYTPIFDLIDETLNKMDLIDFDYEFDHIGGEVQSDKEYLDLYYLFTKKVEELKI